MSAMSDSQVREIARPILGEELQPIRIEDVSVKAEEDFDGVEILRMVARISDEVSARQMIDAVDAVRTALRGRGDGRYVYLSVRTPYDAEPGADDDEGKDVD